MVKSGQQAAEIGISSALKIQLLNSLGSQNLFLKEVFQAKVQRPICEGVFGQEF